MNTVYHLPDGSDVIAVECPTPTLDKCPLGLAPHVKNEKSFLTLNFVDGPATIMVGPCLSQTLFVPAGTRNFDTNLHTQTFVECLLAPASVPALSEWAFMVMAALLTGFGVWRIAYHPKV